jgi:uncharacterized protein YyaL (SSP411 family)
LPLLVCAAAGFPAPAVAQDPAATASPAAATPSGDILARPLPGASALDPAVAEELRAAWKKRPADYRPRTRHLNPDGSPQYTNRLFLQTSPYLRQHAHNPVNWYPWGDEAFETATKLGRPVLLSVGYSTCHWCHVMEEESFEDLEIARYMNEHYIAIKVDREERPDIDAVYMSAVQALNDGRGGWPMTVWLRPDRKPFFGGTYFPARDGDRGAATGFLTLLRKLDHLYHQDPMRVAAAASSLAKAVRESLSGEPGREELPGPEVLRAAEAVAETRFDAENGGTRGAPKFPSDLPLRFLLRYHRRAADRRSLAMATLTLEKMAAGGICDQVGGGFHRYSTDSAWLVPHFEKMLYDNALLAVAYLEAHQATGREDFAGVARDILRYARRDMMSPQGAYYSASDADSPAPSGRREEGWFYTWTPAEIERALDARQARVAEAYFAVTAKGNFEGRNILHTPQSLAQVAENLGLPPEKVRALVESSKDRLYAARAERPAPLRDEKILAAWNGLMISALARAALVLGDDRYAASGARAASFVLDRMRENGRLLRSYEDGEPRHDAYLDDYAFVIAGLLDLYEADGNPRWLREAVALDGVLAQHFEDPKAGGFFLTGDDHEELLAREKPSDDGAEPSGNSVEALNLLRLYELTTDERYRRRADRTLRAIGGVLQRAPSALSEMLLAIDFRLDVPKEIIIVTPDSRARAEPLLAVVRKTFVPNRVLTVVVAGEPLKEQSALVPLVQGKAARGGKPTAYVCERQVCELPTTDPSRFAAQLAEVKPLAAEQGGGSTSRGGAKTPSEK